MKTFQRNKMMRPKMKTSLKVRVDLPMMMTKTMMSQLMMEKAKKMKILTMEKKRVLEMTKAQLMKMRTKRLILRKRILLVQIRTCKKTIQ